MVVVLVSAAAKATSARRQGLSAARKDFITRWKRRGLFASSYHCIDNASEIRFQNPPLFGGDGEGGLGFLDHLAHLADAFGALRRALVAGEDVLGTVGARLDGEGDVTLAKTVTVADVQGEAPGTLRMARYSTY
jgi:hypothetical protein